MSAPRRPGGVTVERPPPDGPGGRRRLPDLSAETSLALADAREQQRQAELAAMPRDQAAERGETKPSFSLAGHIPARVMVVGGARLDRDVISLSLKDADGRVYRFRLSRDSAQMLYGELQHYCRTNSHSLSSSEIPSSDGSPNDGQWQVPPAAASAAD